MVFLGMKNRVSKLLNLGLLAAALSLSHIGSSVAVEYSASFKNADINEFINIVGKKP